MAARDKFIAGPKDQQNIKNSNYPTDKVNHLAHHLHIQIITFLI